MKDGDKILSEDDPQGLIKEKQLHGLVTAITAVAGAFRILLQHAHRARTMRVTRSKERWDSAL
jgi:hypothetical protein